MAKKVWVAAALVAGLGLGLAAYRYGIPGLGSLSSGEGSEPAEAPPAVVQRLPAELVCEKHINRNFIEAMETNKAHIDAVANMDWRTGEITSAQRRAIRQTQVAQGIDLAATLAEAARERKSGKLADFFREEGQRVESLAGKNWRQDDIDDSEIAAMRRGNLARAVDMAEAFLRVPPATTGNFSAYRETHRGEVERISHKDWRKDELTEAEENLVVRGVGAHLMDVAAALVGLPPTSRFAAQVGKHRPALEQVARKNWKSDEIEVKESVAVCEILGALTQTASPPQ